MENTTEHFKLEKPKGIASFCFRLFASAQPRLASHPKGYTIPLDKRLAADGRGLQTVHINENFSKLAEALYIADRKAREAIEMRAKMEKTLAEKEKAKKEDDLKQLASQIREQRSGIKPIKEGWSVVGSD
jgi:hypothetical protein